MDSAHGFEDGNEIDFLFRLVRIPTGKHRPPADKDSRDIQSGSGHKHARYDLVTVGDHDKGVKGVGRRHDLDGIGDQFTASEGILHARVIHGNAVTNTDGAEGDGEPSSHVNTCLYGLDDPAQVDVSRNDLVFGSCDSDEGSLHFPVRVAHGLKKRTMGCPINTFPHTVTFHVHDVLFR